MLAGRLADREVRPGKRAPRICLARSEQTKSTRRLRDTPAGPATSVTTPTSITSLYDTWLPLVSLVEMSSSAQPAAGERWTICRLGHVHWGANGGAGLLLRHAISGSQPRYLLALRSRWVDEPATWGIPGGAIRAGESPEAAARREMSEEIGHVPVYRVTGEQVQDCGGGWRFHVFLADVDEMFDAYSVLETDATGWFTTQEMLNLPLHPGVRLWLSELEASSRHDRPAPTSR